MENFKKEAKELSTQDLLLILEDQLDLYSAEEIAILREELASRPKDALEQEAEEQERLAEEQEQLERIRAKEAAQEERKSALEARRNKLRSNGYEGYYEYTTLSLVDNDGGGLTADQVSWLLNEYALDGWRLVSAYTNELGHNSTSGGFGGFSAGSNSTIDQHILILERYIKL